MTESKEHINSESEEVQAVQAIKLPTFFKANPNLWFMQVEAQFHISKIKNDASKYYMVVAALDTEVLHQVSDVLNDLPPQRMYETLKNKIIQRFSESENQQIRKLLTDLELGDRKPSQLLREMRNLAADKISDKILGTLWLQRLPQQIQMVVSTSSGMELNQMAEVADRLVEIITPYVCAATATSPPTTSSDEIAQIKKQVDELTRTVDRLTTRRSRSLSRGKRGEPICYFHKKFGDNATKCKQWCIKYKKPSEN